MKRFGRFCQAYLNRPYHVPHSLPRNQDPTRQRLSQLLYLHQPREVLLKRQNNLHRLKFYGTSPLPKDCTAIRAGGRIFSTAQAHRVHVRCHARTACHTMPTAFKAIALRVPLHSENGVGDVELEFTLS